MKNVKHEMCEMWENKNVNKLKCEKFGMWKMLKEKKNYQMTNMQYAKYV